MIAIVMVGMIAALLAYVVVDGLIHQRRFQQHFLSVLQGKQLSSRPGKRLRLSYRRWYHPAYGIQVQADEMPEVHISLHRHHLIVGYY